MRKEAALKLKLFCQEIINTPRALEDQSHIIEDGHIWCDDWRLIEILKCLFLGEETYHSDPSPKRIKNSHLWSKSEIVHEANLLRASYKTIEELIDELRNKRDAPRIAGHV